MKERPILFGAPMVRAILEGRKTQTRRIAKLTDSGRVKEIGSHKNWHVADPDAVLACPKGVVGDRLWVRETWNRDDETGELCYRADCTPNLGSNRLADMLEHDRIVGELWARWRPSIHMPRWASRINLEITDVRVQRLQDISDEDAKAEGAEPVMHPGHPSMENKRHIMGFMGLWWDIHSPYSWVANPWVWAISFKPA